MIRRKIQMTDNTSFLTIILYVMLAIMFALAVALIFIYLNMKVQEKCHKASPLLSSFQPVPQQSQNSDRICTLMYTLKRTLPHFHVHLICMALPTYVERLLPHIYH